MSTLTKVQKIEIMEIYRKNSARKTADIFNERYPDRRPKLNFSTVFRIYKKFETTGSIENRPKSGRPSKAKDEDNILLTLSHVAHRPKTSIRALSREIPLCRSTVTKILKDKKIKPYKAEFHNKFYGTDRNKRLQFCLEFKNRLDNDATLLRRILWSDESLFKLSGSFNRQNNR